MGCLRLGSLGACLTFVLYGAVWPQVTSTKLVSGFTQPTHVASAKDGSGRLFVVEQPGRIRIVRAGVLAPQPFLDIAARVSCCGERGLLSVVFPPNFQARRYFYVDYTNLNGDTVIARYALASDNVADPASETILLTIAQPFANHNGGQLAFGPDGFLYIGMGDGGAGGDPFGNGQNPMALLGKILRIDVESGAATYAVPPTNPFVSTPGYRPEIWALGLRNPWRFSFDRMTGDLYIADVGEGSYEEVNFQPSSSRGGENYGWNVMEGKHCFRTPCSVSGFTLPVAEYDHSLGCAVTGGFVYRGTRYPGAQGIYFYADYCSGRIWGLRRTAAGWENSELLASGLFISSFGEDDAGELYVADQSGGAVFALALDPQVNQPPVAVSVTPNAGSGAGGVFSFVSTDPNGATDLLRTHVQFTSAGNAAASCEVAVIFGSAYLANETKTAFLGPVALGSGSALENSYCRVDGAGSSSQAVGNNQTLNLNVTFKPVLAGVLNVSLAPEDAAGAVAALTKVGTWTVPGAAPAPAPSNPPVAPAPPSAPSSPPPAASGPNQPPVAVSVTPNAGGGAGGVFSFVSSDPNGAADILRTHVQFTAAGNGAASCEIAVIFGGAYVADETKTLWLGPARLGTAASVENSYCRVDGAGSSLQALGNNQTVNLSVTFKPALAGPLTISLAPEDSNRATAPWTQVGTWTAAGAAPPAVALAPAPPPVATGGNPPPPPAAPGGNQPPVAVSVSPNSGSGASGVFSFTSADPNGAADIMRTHVQFTSAGNAAASCEIAVIFGAAYLADETHSLWLGPAGLGTASVVENSYCRVEGAGSSIQAAGNNQTLNLSVTFKPPLAGLLNVLLAPEDSARALAAWTQVGTWTASGAAPPPAVSANNAPPPLVQAPAANPQPAPAAAGNQPPVAVSVIPNTGTGASRVFSFISSDPNGAADLMRTHVRFTLAGNTTASCEIAEIFGGLYLLDDTQSIWLGPAKVASAGSVENSYCRVDGAGSSIQALGNNQTLNVNVTFKPALAGLLNVSLAPEDSSRALAAWTPVGTWTAPGPNQP